MPDWVLQEKKEFEEMFDKNKDGKYVLNGKERSERTSVLQN